MINECSSTMSIRIMVGSNVLKRCVLGSNILIKAFSETCRKTYIPNLHKKCCYSTNVSFQKYWYTGTRSLHSEVNVSQDEELTTFLDEEINAENKFQKSVTIPSEICGFEVHLNGSEVMLSKTSGDESIEIYLDINHSTDTASDAENDDAINRDELAMLKSNPNFDVEIRRNDTTLLFTCSCTIIPRVRREYDEEEEDTFNIDSVSVYHGKWNDTNYIVPTNILDDELLRLLEKYLKEKGISNEFVKKMCELSTNYEHSAYINLLSDLKKFVTK